jgi:hypothetical protein
MDEHETRVTEQSFCNGLCISAPCSAVDGDGDAYRPGTGPPILGGVRGIPNRIARGCFHAQKLEWKSGDPRSGLPHCPKGTKLRAEIPSMKRLIA